MFMRDDVRVDTRALAAFRIGLGVLLLVDVLLRARNFTRFYTDDGVVPYDIVQQDPFPYASASLPIWELSTSPVFTGAVFTAAGIVAVCLITGYKTRLMTVLGFLLVAAIDARNPYVLSYADLLFHLLFLWAIFLPLGERWSLDAARRDREPRHVIASVWSALVLGQLVFMYISNAYYKLTPNWTWSGDVLPIMLSMDAISHSWVGVLVEFTTVFILLSYGWVALMLFAPVLFFLRGHRRAVFALCFIAAHLMMAATLRIGAFPFVAITGLVLFIPPETWTTVCQRALQVQRVHEAYLAARGVADRIATATRRVEPSLAKQRRARRLAARGATAVFVVSALLLGVVVTGGAIGVVDTDRTVTGTVDETMHVFGLHQPAWEFYAGDPPYEDRYYVFWAETDGGTEFDAFADREASFDRPYEDSELHKQYAFTYRERFYMAMVAGGGEVTDGTASALQDELASDVCDRSFESVPPGEDIETFTMYEVREEISIENRADRDERPVTVDRVATHDCSDPSR